MRTCLPKNYSGLGWLARLLVLFLSVSKSRIIIKAHQVHNVDAFRYIR